MFNFPINSQVHFQDVWQRSTTFSLL